VDKFGEGWERDPNHINTHLQVMWDDIVGEPEGIKSLDCTWNCSRSCFQCTRNGCYILLTLLMAPCLAFGAGLNFACLSFQHIWCNGPGLRVCKIQFAFARKINKVVMAAVVAPCTEAMGLVLSKAKVRTMKMEASDEDDPNQIFIT